MSERYCRNVTRQRARNFYFGLMLTPQPRRAALYAIYAWMRCADDLADESPGPTTGAIRLEDFAARTKEVLDSGNVIADEASLWPSFQQTLRQYPIQRQWLDEALNGLRRDQNPGAIQTRGELDLYCHEVAGTVGMICTAIWRSSLPESDSEWATALELARKRGLAFQLTNILRDIGTDAQMQPPRTYLPLDSYRKFGLTPEDVLKWRDERACRSFIEQWVDEARKLYHSTQELDSMIPGECRRSLATMTRLYQTLLERIAMNPKGVVSDQRIRVPLVRKLTILSSSLLVKESTVPHAHATA